MAERDTSLVLDPAWDSAGLITGIVTDAASGELLMVAHLNDEALALTQSTGIAHFWSRSRSRIWKKGEESGNVMRVKGLRIDCDQDALWIVAEPAGPACHTGERSCFFRQIDGTALSVPKAHASESRLIGTWHLVSFEMQGGDGTTTHPLSEHPQGQIVYDDVGNMSCHLLNPDPPARPNDASDGADYEARMSYTRYASYYGRYEVDTAAKVVHHHVTGALMPGWAGTTVDRDYVFDGDDNLALSAKIEAIDQLAVLKWQRAK